MNKLKEAVRDTPFAPLIRSVLNAYASVRAKLVAMAFKRYAQRFASQLWTTLDDAQFPDELWSRTLKDLACEPYQSLLAEWDSRPTVETDVAFIVRRFTPDVLKDVVALHRTDPDLHITVFAKENQLATSLGEEHLGQVIIWNYYLELASLLEKLQARCVVVVRRGATEGIVLSRLFWSGRLIYRPWPFAHIMPDGDPERVRLTDLQAEQWLIERSEGVYHFFDEKMKETLSTLMSTPGPVIQILPECVAELDAVGDPPEKLSEEDGQIHIVYGAGLYRAGGWTPRTAYVKTFPTKFRNIISQEIHLHIHTPYLMEGELHPDLVAMQESRFFHLEPSLEYLDFLRVLQRYDWSLYHFSYEDFSVRPGFEWFASNALFTYIQAGLPVIVSPSTPGLSEVVTSNGIGLSIRDTGFETLAARISECDPEVLAANIDRAQERYCFQHRKLYRLFLANEFG